MLSPIVSGDITSVAGYLNEKNLAFVGNVGTDDITVIDTNTDQVINTIKLNTAPLSLTSSPDESKVYVTDWFKNNILITNIVHTFIYIRKNILFLKNFISKYGTVMFITNTNFISRKQQRKIKQNLQNSLTTL